MTSGANNLIRTTNCIARLRNSLSFFIDSRFQENKVPSIVNTLGVSGATILDKNFRIVEEKLREESVNFE